MRACVLDKLRLLATPAALALVRNGLAEPAGPTRTAALRSLCLWPDATALPDLLGMLRDSSQDGDRARVLNAYLRITLGDPELAPAARLEHLDAAWSATRLPEERTRIIAMYGDVANPGSLDRLGRYLDDPALADSAAAAVVKLANALRLRAWPQSEALLRRIAETSTNEALRRDAQEALIRLAPPPESPARASP